MPPKTGTKYTYSAEQGLGATHAEQELPTEQAELDLQPGTTVEYLGYDDERDLVLLQWVDSQGNKRITSVEPDGFSQNFTKGG